MTAKRILTAKDFSNLLEGEMLQLVETEIGGYEKVLGNIEIKLDNPKDIEPFILASIFSYLKERGAGTTIELLESYIAKIR